MIDSIYLQYRFAEKDNRWGLQDQQGNWVVAPKYYDYYNSYDVLPDGDVYLFPDNMYILKISIMREERIIIYIMKN